MATSKLRLPGSSLNQIGNYVEKDSARAGKPEKDPILPCNRNGILTSGFGHAQ